MNPNHLGLLRSIFVAACLLCFQQTAKADQDWEVAFRAKAQFLCQWISAKNLSNNVPRPSVCSSLYGVSADAAYDQVENYWNEWKASDTSAATFAHSRFNEDWDSRWTALKENRALPAISDAPLSTASGGSNSSPTRVTTQAPAAPSLAAITQCQLAMTRSVYQDEALSTDQRHAAISLCQGDPQAYQKPLPWEQGSVDAHPSETTNASGQAVPLKFEGGIYVVPVVINDRITLDFGVDSGAASVSIPVDVFSTLMRTGTIRSDDVMGSTSTELADGSTVQTKIVRIRSLRVGGLELHDVKAFIVPPAGSLLLGQSFLSRLNTWSIDNKRHVLLLNQ